MSPAFGGCVGAGGFHSIATPIGLSEFPGRHAGPRVSRYVVRRASEKCGRCETRHGRPQYELRQSSGRMFIPGARLPPLPHHVAQSHMGTEARCTPQPCRSFVRRTPGGLCSLLTILIAIMQVARAWLRRWAGMLSLTLPRRAERQDRRRINCTRHRRSQRGDTECLV